MTPIVQRCDTDCLNACIASLLDLPYEAVPHFYQGLTPGEPVPVQVERWMWDWFAGLGLFLIDFPMEAHDQDSIMEAMDTHHHGLHYMVVGQNRRGQDHVVICKDCKQVWNPTGKTQRLSYPLESSVYHILMIGKLV